MQLYLPYSDSLAPIRSNHSSNKLDASDRSFHDWYRFVLSFPPHLVRDYIERFGLQAGQTLLDPFCGTGTTVVEAKKLGISSIGIEANRMAHLASSVKLDWSVNPDDLLSHSNRVAETAIEILDGSPNELLTLPPEAFELLLKDSISALPLHKALVLKQMLHVHRDERLFRHELLALAKTLVFSASNLYFGPEVGVRREKRADAPVVQCWLEEVRAMVNDVQWAENTTTPATVYLADAREIEHILKPESIDAVFTSPPYPNEKDYTRTTRLESVILGLINNKHELQLLKRGLLRSNTRNVYKGDQDDHWIVGNVAVREIADAIDARRIELGKTSGFERLYGKVTRLYFGGMARHLAVLRPFLKPGALLGYVVGDQASYFQVMIRTGQLLAEIAETLGYEVVEINIFRTRLATATKQQIREEVVILRWPGYS